MKRSGGVETDSVDEPFGMYEAECAGCDCYVRVNDLGLCEECSGKCERDLLRMRDWAYATSAYALTPAQRDELRNAVIKKYGIENELLAPIDDPSSKRKGGGATRRGRRPPKRGQDEASR